jgi:hypothetical protein
MTSNSAEEEMSVVAEGKFAFADVWDGTLRACRKTLINLTGLGVLTIISAVFMGLRRHEGWAGEKLLIGVGIFWIVYLWPFMMYRTNATLKRTPNLQGPVRFEFSETGYALDTVHARAEVKWGALTKWIETGKSFLLYQNPKIGSVVPKRFFQSAADVETVRGYLRANVKKK